MTLAASAYGLHLRLNVPVPGLPAAPAHEPADLDVTFGRLSPRLEALPESAWHPFYAGEEVDDDGNPALVISKLDDGSLYRASYLDGTRVFVDARGEAIHAVGPDGATLEDTAIYVLGPLLGFTLRLRGTTCLHASAVGIDGQAVAFVGCSEAGKSSIAAAFAIKGFPVLTDDVAALVDRGDSFLVQPAYPRVRLWPDSVEALFGEAEALPRITPSWEKRYLDLESGEYRFARHPLPLAAVYLLGARRAGQEEVEIEAVGAKEALMSLVAESYTARLLDKSMRANEFDVLARLARSVPVRRLVPPCGIHRTPGLCERVIRDVRDAVGLAR